jgi:hypothetical protein
MRTAGGGGLGAGLAGFGPVPSDELSSAAPGVDGLFPSAVVLTHFHDTRVLD